MFISKWLYNFFIFFFLLLLLSSFKLNGLVYSDVNVKGLKSKQHVTGVNQETQIRLENKQFIARLSLSLGSLELTAMG